MKETVFKVLEEERRVLFEHVCYFGPQCQEKPELATTETHQWLLEIETQCNSMNSQILIFSTPR